MFHVQQMGVPHISNTSFGLQKFVGLPCRCFLREIITYAWSLPTMGGGLAEGGNVTARIDGKPR